MADGLTRGLLAAFVVLLAILVWRVSDPLKLQIVGPFQSGGSNSGIPLALNMSGPAAGQFDVQVVTDREGVLITRIDRFSGSIDLFRLDGDGKLRRVDYYPK